MVFAGEIGPDKSAKIIPQMIFLFCGVFAQFLGTGKGLFLLFHIRTIPLIRPVRTLGRMRGQILDWVRYTQREFRRLRAASYFARGGKDNTPPGTAPDEHFVLIVAYPTPLSLRDISP